MRQGQKNEHKNVIKPSMKKIDLVGNKLNSSLREFANNNITKYLS